MGSLTDHHSTSRLRLLGMGDPSTGKTGSLAELANNMSEFGLERIIIADWDDGLDVLKQHVKPEAQDKVFYETLRDELKADVGDNQMIVRSSGDVVTSKRNMAWARGIQLMNRWKVKDSVDLGPALEWGPETLFVSDTITGMGDACINYARTVLGIGDDWRATGRGMALQDKYIQMCCSLKCHFILFSHLKFMGGGGQVATDDTKHPGITVVKDADSISEGKAYPSALGRQLPPNVGRHFNTVLEWELMGTRRIVRTEPKMRMALKLPIKLKAELPQETALLEVFRALLK